MNPVENGPLPAESTIRGSRGATRTLPWATLHLAGWLLILLVGWPRVQTAYGELLDGASLPWPTQLLFSLGKPACWGLALIGTALIVTLGQAAHPAWYRWTCVILLGVGGLLGTLGILWPALALLAA